MSFAAGPSNLDFPINSLSIVNDGVETYGVAC